MKKVFLFFFLFFGAYNSYAQKIDDVYDQIEKKLAYDKKYLDIYAVPFAPKAEDLVNLKDIPLSEGKSNFNFKIGDDVSYSIVFLKDNLELDSLVVLYIKEITTRGGGNNQQLFDEGNATKIDSLIVVRCRDLQELYFNHQNYYNELYNLINRMNTIENPAVSLLGVNTFESMGHNSGISSEGNIDFLNYYATNSTHKYPKILKKAAVVDFRGQGDTVTTSEFQIDASFSHLTFFHKYLDYGFGTVSAEVSTDSKGLNLLPWQSMTVSGGVRSMISTSGSNSDLKDGFLIDAKFLGRFRVNTYSFLKDIPFIFTNDPVLNVGSGIIVDLKTTGIYGFPFVNLYLATGSEDVSTPYIKLGNDAYFSFTQWEATMSFFWNSSKDMFVRYKMDVGIGGHDVVSANYDASNGSVLDHKFMKDVITPVINFSMNVVPNNVEFMGVEAKLFNSQFTFKFWLKLFEISTDNSFRFETFFISSPFFRNPEQWEEQKGKNMVQLRYRYGF